MKKVVQWLIVFVILTFQIFGSIRNVHGEENTSEKIQIENPVGDLITSQKEEMFTLPKDPRFGAVSVAVFLAANPALIAGILVLGLACLAVGVRFNSLEEAYSYGQKVRSYLTASEFAGVVIGLKLLVNDAVKKAMAKALNDGEITIVENPNIYYGVDNYWTSTVNWIPIRPEVFIENCNQVEMTTEFNDDSKVVEWNGTTLRSKETFVEFWHNNRPVVDWLTKANVYMSGGHRWEMTSLGRTARGGVKFRIGGYKYNNSSLSRITWIEGVIPSNKRDAERSKIFNMNATVTFADGTSFDVIGDRADNMNPYREINDYMDQIYPSGSEVLVNDNYPVGSLGALDIPGLLVKPNGYTDDDISVIANLDSVTGEVIDTTPEDPDSTPDEEAGEGSILDWLLKIWNIVNRFLNPMSNNIIKILENTGLIYNLIGAKASESRSYLSQQFGSVFTKFADIATSIAGIPQSVAELIGDVATGEVDFSAVLDAVAAVPGNVADTIGGLWEDAGAIWDGLSDEIKQMNVGLLIEFANVKAGIESGVKTVGDWITGVKEGIESGVKTVGDSIVETKEGIESGVRDLSDSLSASVARVGDMVQSIPDTLADIWAWLKEFFIPDFTGIKNAWSNMLDRLKLKFKPILDIATSFTSIYASRKSIYDIELEVFGRRFNPVPIALKPAIDGFRLFMTGLCMLLTYWRIYRRLTGEGDLIAT